MTEVSRRTVVGAGLAAPLIGMSARGTSVWNAGPVRHLVPTVSENALSIAASFDQAQTRAPTLHVGNRRVDGAATDTEGRFWSFMIGDLAPGRSYSLRIDAGASGRTDTWPLRTLPARETLPSTFRLLSFTCAGGEELLTGVGGRPYFNAMAARHLLLDRALSFAPDALVANGDHVYWDQESAIARGGQGVIDALRVVPGGGPLDHRLDPAATANLRIIEAVAGRQIADLYGTRLRSLPSWFVSDDHDYFNNDVVIDGVATFPPTPFNLSAHDQLQQRFWPAFLPDPARPELPGRGGSFGTLRWGRLFEGLMYDCRRTLGPDGFVPVAVERWIADRSRDDDVRHVVQIPSVPFGWTAGKWGEWYPDVRNAAGKLTTETAKPDWHPRWFDQHQRLVALAGSRARASLVLSGDLHAVATGTMTASGGLHLSQPVHLVLTGPLGTGDLSFPSAARGAAPAIATGIAMTEHLPPREENGFTILDIGEKAVRIRQFAWRTPTPLGAIATMAPVLDRVMSLT